MAGAPQARKRLSVLAAKSTGEMRERFDEAGAGRPRQAEAANQLRVRRLTDQPCAKHRRGPRTRLAARPDAACQKSLAMPFTSQSP